MQYYDFKESVEAKELVFCCESQREIIEWSGGLAGPEGSVSISGLGLGSKTALPGDFIVKNKIGDFIVYNASKFHKKYKPKNIDSGLKIRRIMNNTLSQPIRETAGAAGYDLRAFNIEAGHLTLEPLERALIQTGFAWEIPQGMVGNITPRSGLAYRKGLQTMAGTIDSDYRGEISVLLINLGDTPIMISNGDRIAQMVVVPHYSQILVEVDKLNERDRGDNGFGSTGSR